LGQEGTKEIEIHNDEIKRRFSIHGNMNNYN
jgi:hypothetical protein